MSSEFYNKMTALISEVMKHPLPKIIRLRRNDMNKQLVRAAEGAKAAGYEFMTAIVKKQDEKLLYNVVSIDHILKFGEWSPAESKILEGGLHAVKVWDKVPEKSISKSEALRKYR